MNVVHDLHHFVLRQVEQGHSSFLVPCTQVSARVSDMNANDFLSLKLLIEQWLHFFVSLCVKNTNDSNGVSDKNVVIKHCETSAEAVVPVVMLLKQFGLNLTERTMNKNLFFHFVIIFVERQKLGGLFDHTFWHDFVHFFVVLYKLD